MPNYRLHCNFGPFNVLFLLGSGFPPMGQKGERVISTLLPVVYYRVRTVVYSTGGFSLTPSGVVPVPVLSVFGLR